MEKIKILFAGDFSVRGEGVKNLYDEKMNELSASVREATDNYDISMVNIETVFTDELTPVKKSGPTLAAPVKALDLLSKMGFTIGAFANNHTCDQGVDKGLNSVKMVADTGMLTVGCGRNLEEAARPVRIEKNGIKISFLNFAENEFTSATESSFGFSPMDFYDNGCMVRKEKEDCDFALVMLHAGSEQCPMPRTGLRKYCRHLIDSGADAVIISHPHTPQGYEYYCGKPIVYSMGNFFMTKRSEEFTLWNVGYMADITINEDRSISFAPVPYAFGSYGEYFEILKGDKKEIFLDYLNKLCGILLLDSEEYKKLEYSWSISYMNAAWNNFLKEMAKDQSPDGEFMLFNKNAFCCETHAEVLGNFFEVLTTGRINDFEKQGKKISEWLRLPEGLKK